MADNNTYSWVMQREGSFKSLSGVTWKVQIMKYTDEAAPEAEELTFAGEEPLVIEWEEKAKYESVCGSSATLKLISTTDREFLSWYTIEPGIMRMDVYRAGSLYWSGLMDTEFYEEPFNMEKNYEVSFTFTDFGILERIPFALTGIKTLGEIVTQAVSDAKLNLTRQVVRCSTYLTSTDASPITVSSLSVRADNFYDEDGEAKTMMEVLEGILQPLNLKIMQKVGRLVVFDLHAIATASVHSVNFIRDDAQLSMDDVYNNVKVTFSPYGMDEIISSDVTPDRDAFSEDDATQMDYADDTLATFNDSLDYNTSVIDLACFHNFEAEAAIEYLNTDYGQYFKFAGSDDTAGIMHGFKHLCTQIWTPASGSTENPGSTPTTWGLDPTLSGIGRTVLISEKFRTKGVYIPNMKNLSTGVGEANFGLCINMKMLLDPRYNPFQDASIQNKINEYEALEDNIEYVRVGVQIKLKDANGNVLYHWENRYNDSTKKLGEWVEGDESVFDYSAFLVWIKKDHSCPILGWQPNHHAFAGYLGRLYSNDHEGQIIEFPPVAGFLSVSVMNNYSMYKWNESTSEYDNYSNSSINFFMLQVPTVTIVKTNAINEDCEAEDYEYSSVCNQYAKEELSIDTLCGSTPTLNPTCKGVYIRTAEQLPMSKMYLWNDDTPTCYHMETLCRNGLTDTPENLLIRTLVGQYSARHIKLSGTIDLQNIPLPSANYETTTYNYLLLSDRQDVANDTSEVVMVQTFPDGKNSAGDDVAFTKALASLDRRPRSERLRNNNIALVKKDARRKI